jgi:rare lipoprotein A (peptidoglycan hydrolase)
MSKVLFLATLALAAVSVSGLVIPRKTAPPNWAWGYLEDYTTYHVRYLALDCESQHGQSFFDDCCHPLLATETLQKDRKPMCTPDSQAYSSAMAAEPTSTVNTPADDDDGDDCDDDGDNLPSSSTSSSSTFSSSSSPTPSPKPNGNNAPDTSTHTTPPPSHTHTSTSTSSTSTASPSNGGGSSNSGSSSGSSSGDGDLITGGVATFFTQGGNAGACGQVHQDSDFIAAMDQARYGNAGGVSPLCGKQVKITNTKNGKTVTVTVADDCPTCENPNSIDLSVAAFDSIAPASDGEVPIVWSFV